jgi:hypothetical protein
MQICSTFLAALCLVVFPFSVEPSSLWRATGLLPMPRGCGKGSDDRTESQSGSMLMETMAVDVTQEYKIVRLVVRSGVFVRSGVEKGKPVKDKASLLRRTGVIDSALRAAKDAEAGVLLGSRTVCHGEAHLIIIRTRSEHCKVYIASLSRGKSAVSLWWITTDAPTVAQDTLQLQWAQELSKYSVDCLGCAFLSPVVQSLLLPWSVRSRPQPSRAISSQRRSKCPACLSFDEHRSRGLQVCSVTAHGAVKCK